MTRRRSSFKPLRIAISLVFAVSLGFSGPIEAFAQQPQPSAKAGKPTPSASAKAGPAGSSSAAAGSSASMPPGHPPTEPLPSGHPPVDDGDDPRRAPHGGSGHGREPNPGFYQAPEDMARDDPELPPGTIVVRVADAEDKPIPSAPLTLGILRNTVAKGESRERMARDADAKGELRLDGLEIGSGVTYRVSTVQGPATYAVAPFSLSDKAGKRVILHSYEVATDINEVLVGMQGIVYLSLREDAMSIEHLFNVFNVGPVSWVPEDVIIELPDGFKAFVKPEAMEDTRFDEVSGKGAALRGTFKPGQHSATFRYQVPLSGDPSQTFRIEMPPHLAQMRVMVEASKSMTLDAKGFPPAQKSKNRDGKKILLTERQVERAEGGIKILDLTVSGLPTPSPVRWIALVLGALAIAGGGAYAFQRREATDLADDTRDDLVDAQRALLDEVVALERAHKSGSIGPKTYARVRAALMDALARITDMLESEKSAVDREDPEDSEGPEDPKVRPQRRVPTRGRTPAVGT